MLESSLTCSRRSVSASLGEGVLHVGGKIYRQCAPDISFALPTGRESHRRNRFPKGQNLKKQKNSLA